MLVGFWCFAAALINFYAITTPLRQSSLKFNSNKSIKYTAVFPYSTTYIKREIAKYDEREREMMLRTETV